MVFQDKEGSTPILPTPLPTNPHILGVHMYCRSTFRDTAPKKGHDKYCTVYEKSLTNARLKLDLIN